jgi:hypothetical protein
VQRSLLAKLNCFGADDAFVCTARFNVLTTPPRVSPRTPDAIAAFTTQQTPWPAERFFSGIANKWLSW